MGIAVLLRHGRSTANVEGILAGRRPGVALHDSGREQAQHLARAFRDIPVASIHVSPLERTLETAAIVFGERDFQLADALLECDYGQWSGLPIASLHADPLWDLLHRRPSDTRFPDGESIPEVAQRVTTFVREACAGPGIHVLVTHADPIMMVLGHAAGAPLDAYQRLDVEPCSLNAVLVEAERLGVMAVNVPPSGAGELLAEWQQWLRSSVGPEGGEDAKDHPPVRPA